MRERFGAREERSLSLRFHAQTGGSTLTAQQPENNVVRVALQVLSAALGGAQSIHSNGFDEALALPTEALGARSPCAPSRSSPPRPASPTPSTRWAGAGSSSALTAEMEERAEALIDEIEARGGAVECIEFMREAIEESRCATTARCESGRASGDRAQRPGGGRRGAGAAAADRPGGRGGRRSRRVRRPAGRGATPPRSSAARRTCAPPPGAPANLLPPMREALRARATVGEVCGVLREEWGEYDRLLAARGSG